MYIAIQPMAERPINKIIDMSGPKDEAGDFIILLQMLNRIFPQARQIKLI
jgi:hypothetical protein